MVGTARLSVTIAIVPIMNDEQLVLQPRGGTRYNGPANFDLSVRRGVRLADHAATLGADLAVLETLYRDEPARIWGSTPTRSSGNAKAVALRGRKVGDQVLFYADMAFFAKATILHLFHNPDLAKSVWGTDEDGDTWEHIMALGDVHEFEVPIPAARILGPLGLSTPLRSLTLVSADKHTSVRDLITAGGNRPPAHWILGCDLDQWDVWSWWESRSASTATLTITRHVDELRIGDRFALWVSGGTAGIYAIGTLTSTPYPVESPEDGATRHVVDVRFDRFLFDRPLTRQALESDPVFADLTTMMSDGAGSVPLTPGQWTPIERTADDRGRTGPAEPAETVVTSRPPGSVPETAIASGGSGSHVVDFPEARLVERYADFVDRELLCLSALLPTGERLVCDLFDPATNTLIEAKASNRRQDVRMALGQLLDYRHHLKPGAELAVLLPAKPASSIIEVLRAQGVEVIYPDGDVFRGEGARIGGSSSG